MWHDLEAVAAQASSDLLQQRQSSFADSKLLSGP
jgi:hypothetical protein